MAKAYTITPSDEQQNTVEINDINDINAGGNHLAFATAIYQVEDKKAPIDALGRKQFDAVLWRRIGPMLAAPVLLHAVHKAIEWHYGDPWRNSPNTRERAAWKAHADLMQEAVEEATPPPPMVRHVTVAPAPVTLTDNTPKADAITVAYVVKGFFSEVASRGASIDPLTEQCCELGLVDELAEYALLVDKARGEQVLEFPGVWHYEVTEIFGQYLASAWFNKKAGVVEQLPAKAEATAWLTTTIDKAHNQ